MSYLFLDSTYELIVGVLSEELDWLTFEKLAGVKASATIQAKTFELLNQHSIKSFELKGIISVHGPGFYTGLRLAEGFSDVFKFFNIPTFSFYSYDVPKFCGYKKGSWFTKAYRGEYFFYRWDNEKNEQLLVAAKDLAAAMTPEQYFIHSPTSLDQISADLIPDFMETTELLKNNSRKVFSEVLKGMNCDPFYFRAPEDEFKVNP